MPAPATPNPTGPIEALTPARLEVMMMRVMRQLRELVEDELPRLANEAAEAETALQKSRATTNLRTRAEYSENGWKITESIVEAKVAEQTGDELLRREIATRAHADCRIRIRVLESSLDGMRSLLSSIKSVT